MTFGDKTVAGIDITQDRINIVVMKNGKNGPELVKSVSAPVPNGAIKDGNIADPVLLAGAIRNLKRHNRIWTKVAAVSLFARPAILQLMEMPKDMPSNIRQFVNNEIKNCVVLPGRDIAFDFYGTASIKRKGEKKVLATAAEGSRMVQLIKVCSRAGFRVTQIEPSLIAYLRATHKQKASRCNSLVALVQGSNMTICVLSNGVIDFIRTKEIIKATGDVNVVNQWLANELAEVIRFYDIEVPESAGKWEITVFSDNTKEPQALDKCLKSVIEAETVQVRTIEDAYMDTPVTGSVAKENKPSPIAIGLARNLLNKSAGEASLNLVPREVELAREAKKECLIAANAIAMLVLVLVLVIGGFTSMFGRVSRSATEKKMLIDNKETDSMLAQHQHLDTRLQFLSTRLNRIAQISASQSDVNWAMVFDEIRRATPRSIRINSLSSQDNSRVLINGLALSNEAVNMFVDSLAKSQRIASVTLLEAREQEGLNKYIAYQLSCKLGIRSPETNNDN